MLKKVSSFFDENYHTPDWLKLKISRRNALKSAAGATIIAAAPLRVFADNASQVITATASDPWMTLNAVLDHLLPVSTTGPSAKDIQALNYLYNIVHQQPTNEDEKAFIFKGVGWLNGYSNSQLNKAFVTLTFEEKESILRSISQSQAGENWINTLLNYIFEAMLSPPSYGGNPNGVGWKWLEHQAGFPLPKKGERYYEIPSQTRINVADISSSTASNASLNKANVLGQGKTNHDV